MIDRRLGQELLGIWDFAWSMVSYFGLVEAGIGGSVNRYVAKYRAVADIDGVNRIVSSATCVLCLLGILILWMTTGLALLLPQMFGTRLGENLRDSQWVVFFLGASMAIQIALGSFGAVLMGCHRWDIINLVMGGWHAATTVGMIGSLVMGYGLRALSLIYLVGIVLERITRVILAHRICAGLRLHLSLVGRKTVRELYVFGGKSTVPMLSRLLLNSTTNIMIIAYLGPTALALYVRPWSLMRHVEELALKIAAVVVPTISSLQSADELQGIQELLIKSVRYAFYLVLPMVLLMAFWGDAVMQLWMGPHYANRVVPAILAIGLLTDLGQGPAVQVLTGLNAHGRAGLARLIASLCSVGLTLLVLGPLKWGLAGVALGITLPLTFMNVAYLPRLVCRQVGLGVRQYFMSVATGPILHVLPFATCLVVARLVFHTNPLMGLVCGGVLGGAALAIMYYRYAVPDSIRRRVTRLVIAKTPVA
jgi:O-antigen/teichoic acid export membrane protein